MKIAIELYQIIPGSSGGIVPQIHNLLSRAFVLYPAVNFLVYATPRSYRPAEPLPPNVQVIIFPEANFWDELNRALPREQVEVLFRTYPAVENPFFPSLRQIVLIPDLQHELLPKLFSPEVLEVRRRSFPALINNVGAICVYSEYSSQILRQHYPDSPAKIVLVPPGPNLELLQTGAVLTSAEAALIPQEPFFLYPANLWSHKNHQRLCAALEIALSQLPEKISLVLTGDPVGWSGFQTEYPHLPLRHLGFVSSALLQALYRQALALTYFSLYEGFGMPLLEAFALGTPVLCSNLPVLQEVGGTAILSCTPTQPEAMAELMVRISQEADLRQTLITEGYRQLQHYSDDESSRNFVEACQSLAEQPVQYNAYLQILEAALTKLAATQQQAEDKEQVIVELNAANQQRLTQLQQLNTGYEELMATAAEQLDLINRLNISLNELKATAKLQQPSLEQGQVQVKTKEGQLENLGVESQETMYAKNALQLEQAQTETAAGTTELETARQRATGSEPAITGVLDIPIEGTNWRGWVILNGWAFSAAGQISGVEAFLDETPLGFVPYGKFRPDVATAYNSPNLAHTGFSGILRLPVSFLPGQHQLRVRVRDEVGNQCDYYRAGIIKSEPWLRRLLKVRPNETLAQRLYSQVAAGRRRELRYKARWQLTNWKNHLIHYHLGILQQYPPRPWIVPAHYTRIRPPANPPSISIVTPSFNQAGFLERTLCSILDQHYPNLEYIVQDGGSKDHSAEVLQRYSDQLTYWESARDKGQSNALNLGFRRSTGEIMAYLNSDDLLLPGTLNYIAGYFEQNPDVDVVYGQRVIIDEHDQEIGRWIVPPHLHNVPANSDILSWADYIPQETMFWRRRIWEKAGGQIDENFQFAMDWDLILRFRAAQARFVRLPRFLGAFRVHSTQKSSAQITDLGNSEMNHLRERTLGRVPGEVEVHHHTLPYLRKHVFYHKLYRLGILRY